MKYRAFCLTVDLCSLSQLKTRWCCHHPPLLHMSNSAAQAASNHARRTAFEIPYQADLSIIWLFENNQRRIYRRISKSEEYRR